MDFDGDFGSRYGITKGVHVVDSTKEVYAPVAMWLEALDLVFSRLKADEEINPSKPILCRLAGISGSCQQHGSVWWSGEAETLLAGLGEKDGSLVEQLGTGEEGKSRGAFSRPFAPNWQDHSTQAECDAFKAAFPADGPHGGGVHELAQITGSGPHHRFTGPQIMRIRRTTPDVYANTSRISLVSSFLASVLLGRIAPLDVSDACGMNLWDVRGARWCETLLSLVSGGDVAGLRSKLGDVRLDGGGSMGSISPYFVSRYGVSAACQVAPFTGDNPATLLALPLRPGDAIVSLGTSTTFLMVTPHYEPDPGYHFFAHPTTPGQYMFMLCYKNGGLAREKVRDALPASQGAWHAFDKALAETPPLHEDPATGKVKIGLYFPLPEIVPHMHAGVWRYECDSDGGNLSPLGLPPAVSSTADTAALPFVYYDDDVRMIVESQALSMRLRSQPLVDVPADHPSLPAQPRRIYLVGGGSVNSLLCSVVGDVLGGADGVYRLDVGGNACALGGAYKAVWALERTRKPGQGGIEDGEGEWESFDELIAQRWREEGAVRRVADGYKAGVFERYGKILSAFQEMERRVAAEAGAADDEDDD